MHGNVARFFISVLLVLIGAAQAPVFGEGAASLKESVILVEANAANDSVSTSVVPGNTVRLQFRVLKAAPTEAQQVDLSVSPFSAQAPNPAQSLPAKIQFTSEAAGPADGRLRMSLAGTGWFDVALRLEGLRSGATYKGTVLISGGGLQHRWDVTVIAQPQGILQVDPVSTLKVVTFPPLYWLPKGDSIANFIGLGVQSFPITIRNRSEAAFDDVQVRFEGVPAASSKTTSSNFSINDFSFMDGATTLDLAHRGKAPSSFTIPAQGQRTIEMQVDRLSPAEYSGSLRFSSNKTADEAAESKLPLVIQIRHHWILPLFVVLMGSLAGLFGSKYVVGARKARKANQQTIDLQTRANELMRYGVTASGQHFPSEATSYSVARIRVNLRRQAKLTASTLSMLVDEDDIEQRRQETDRRLTALESLRNTRMKAESVSSRRPAAQVAVGRLLRRARLLLDELTFSDTQLSELKSIQQAIDAWDGPQFLDVYRKAILDRLKDDEMPGLSDLPGQPAEKTLDAAMLNLMKQFPAEADINAALVPALETYDRLIARVALLWRERDMPWSEPLTSAVTAGESLDKLFGLVDDAVWDALQAAAKQNLLQVKRKVDGYVRVKADTLVELELHSADKLLPDRRIFYHPLYVQWLVKPPNGEARTMETNGLTCIQFFPMAGEAAVNASLCWGGQKPIAITNPETFSVFKERRFRGLEVLKGWPEFAVIVLATVFAAVTGINAIYDSTFGNFSQYLSLFIWAAGAGTGGNLFKELGTTSTAGGRQDVVLVK